MARVTSMAGIATLVLALRIAPAQQSGPDLTGLWAAKVRFGPDIRGPLLLLREGKAWRADIGGFSVPVSFTAGSVSFELPDRKGNFRGRLHGSELDLAIGFTAGNYSDPALYIPQRAFVPERILPAVH